MEFARIGQRRRSFGFALGKSQRMTSQQLSGQHIEAHALYATGRAGKATFNHFVSQAQSFENLRSLVGLQRRDAHLGHHLQHALGHALAVGGHDFFVVLEISGRHKPFASGTPQGFKGQIGIDGVGAVADQQAVMMDFASFARLQHDPDPSPFCSVEPGDGAPPRRPSGR